METRMDYTPSDNVRAKKHLGQHFLTAPSVASDMVLAGEVHQNDTVIEIGPGTGMLTKELLNTGAHVIAIEKDEECIPKLQESFQTYIENGQFELIFGDIREFEVPNTPYKLIANIPYYITGEIIRTFLEKDEKPQNMVLLVQKEVAERIARSEKESLLSLSVKAFGAPTYVKTVKAGSFHPKPKVDSAILSISNISGAFFDTITEEDFFAVLHQAFSQKRKQVGGTLKEIIPIENLPVDPKTRPEDITLSDWKKIVLLMHK